MLGLREGEAVRFNDQLLICFKGSIRFEDEEITNSPYSVRTVSVPEGALVEQVTEVPNMLVGYDDTNNRSIPPDEYLQMLQVVRGPHYDYDEGEFYFKGDLDAEFATRKALKEFQEEWTAIYSEPYKEYTPLEFTVIGSLEDTGSPFIETSLQAGGAKAARGRGIYEVNIVAASVNEWSKLEKEYGTRLKMSNDSHKGYLRFAKVESKYAFNDSLSYCRSEKGRSLYDDLDKAKAAVERVRKDVRQRVLSHLPSVVGRGNIQQLLEKIKDIGYSVKATSSKQKTYSSHTHALRKIREFEEFLLGLVEDE